MKSLDWSTNIWKNELNEPSNVSVPSLMAYYRANVNDLNNVLGTSFSLNSVVGTNNFLELIKDNDFNILIDDEAANVYKYLYLVSYYGRLIRTFTGVGDINLLIQATSDDGTLRFTDRAGLAKIYLQFRKDAENTLKNLVNRYRFSNQTAVDVIGDDVFVKAIGQPPVAGQLYQRDIY